MRNLYYMRTIGGVPVRLHYSWIVAVLLGIPVIAEIILPAAAPDLHFFTRVALSVLIAALFFLAVVLHECAHLFVARLFRARISTLNIYPLGAITRMPSRQSSVRATFWIAAAGPLLSIALWLGLAALAGAINTPAIALILTITGTLSLYVGLINLLPGLPLDGGRMGYVLLRLISGSDEDATRIMQVCGQLIAYGLMLLGIGAMLSEQNWPRALALIAVGWAIREAGGTARRRALVTKILHQLTAADVLVEPRRIIGPETTLRAFATMLRGRSGNEPTVVIANDIFLGMIDRALLRAVPQGYWDTRTVAETMLSAQQMDSIAPATPVSMLIPRLIQLTTNEQSLPVPVVQSGRLLGLIHAEAMVAFLELEDEFGLFERGVKAPAPSVSLAESGTQAARQVAS
jgi:Zn-dependent protease